MKKFTGFSKVGVIIGIVAIVFVAIASFLVIDANNKATNFDDYDFYSIIGPNADNGEIGDHVKGNADAPVVIFEYADFQCGYCALMNPRINNIVEEADGKLAIVYRTYLLPYHQNGTAAASAAEAAGLQGYWKEYMNKLFAEQDEWAYASASERTALFSKYFETVADGNGNLEQFVSDLSSANVSKKIKFDMGIGKRLDVPGTPSFYIDDQIIDYGNKNGSQITINNITISWDHQLTGDEFNQLIFDIIDAKLGTE